MGVPLRSDWKSKSLMSSQAHKILIVDDDRENREPLAFFLRQHGMKAVAVQDAAEAREYLRSHAFDLILLDIMMPGEDGVSLCKDIREDSVVPIIFMTAMTEEVDRVVGLEIGADDYITKPFSLRELLARVRALLRRVDFHQDASSTPPEHDMAFAGWELHSIDRELISPTGGVVPLSESEYRLLRAFLTHPKTVLTRDKLLDIAYGRQANVYDRTIYNQVNRLRQKIELDSKNPSLIKTAWGNGYILTVDVVVKS